MARLPTATERLMARAGARDPSASGAPRVALATAALLLVAGLSFSGGWVTRAATTGLSCPLSESLVASADLAFVGTLTEIGATGVLATFEVEDVWHGTAAETGETISVNLSVPGLLGAPGDGSGNRFLVLARLSGPLPVVGVGCEGVVYPWDPSYAALRPADAPGAAPDSLLPEVPGPMLALLGAGLALVIVAYLAFRGDAPLRPR